MTTQIINTPLLTIALITAMTSGCGSDSNSSSDTPASPAAEKIKLKGLSTEGKVHTNTPELSFNSTNAGKVSFSGSCSSPMTKVKAGLNTLRLNRLKEGSYSDCSLQVTDSNNISGDVLYISKFTVDLFNKSVQTIDNGNDKVQELTIEQTFDGWHNRLSYKSASIANGQSTTQHHYTTRYTYNPRGQILTAAQDNSANGTDDLLTNNIYTPTGKLLSRAMSQPATHKLLNKFVNEYDANDQLIGRKTDRKGEGRISQVEVITRDDRGNAVRHTTDTNMDGQPNRIQTATYDNNNNQLTNTLDFDADGVIDFSITNTFNKNNILIHSVRKDTHNSAGSMNIAITVDDQGKPKLRTMTTLAGQSIRTEIYNATARLAKVTEFENNKAKRIEAYTYDMFGNEKTHTIDNNADGTTNDLITYMYTY